MRPVAQTVLRLHLESRPYHDDVDAVWRAMFDGGDLLQQYTHQLVRASGFDAPLEAALAYTPHLPWMTDLRSRSLSGRLAQDLLELGLPPAGVAEVPHHMIAPFQSVADGLGWLYVLERSRAVHADVRARLVREHPALSRACSYLDASAALADTRWLRLGELIERVARTPAVEYRILAAAHDGFRELIAWYRAGEPPRHARAR